MVAGTWWFSPWEHLSVAHGTPPRPLSGVLSQGADRFRDARDPVLVAGTLVERSDGGVHAVDLRTGKTWWGLSRPGRARVDMVAGVDGRHAAIVWSDRRLTVVDVPSGHRVHVGLPDRSSSTIDTSRTDREAAAGLTDRAGRSLVAVVQDRGVDTYDASSGRRVWSQAAPHDCFFQDPAQDEIRRTGAFLSLDVDCAEGPASNGNDTTTQYAYSTLLDASSGRPLPGFEHLPDGSLLSVGDHELLQNQFHGVQDMGYRVIDSRTGVPLWRVDMKTLHGGVATVDGGDGLVVVTDGNAGRISAYQAADGKRLWQRTFPDAGGEYTRLQDGTVVGGHVRVIELQPRPVKVITFDGAGTITGTQELPMFNSGGNPLIVGGDYGTLVINDMNSTMAGDKYSYALLTASR
jgi:outer membrane protein assembly factor BamB